VGGVIFGHCAVIDLICCAVRSPTYEGLHAAEVQRHQSQCSYEWVSLDSVSGICNQLDTAQQNLALSYQPCFTQYKIQPL